MNNHKTQAERILRHLKTYDPFGYSEYRWVTLPEILSLGIASHTRRIHELRKAGHKIEIRDEWIGRERHVSYRLVK